MPVKWIITDIDGCISPEESIAWDLDALAELARRSREASAGRSKMAPLVLCTGRPQPYVECLMKVLDIRAPAICESGAVLYTLHDNRARVASSVTSQMIAGLRAVRAFIEAELLPGEPDALLQFGKEAQISVYSHRPALLPPMQKEIEQFVRLRGGPNLSITTSQYYLNISLSGVDKGSTLRMVMDELGVTRGELAGVGDTEGDLPLRDAVGFFACPSNATPGVKAAADYVSPYPNVRGLLDILTQPGMHCR